jgi:acyl-CoA synthetase (NDP forming)
VDIIGDAPVERYLDAVKILFDDKACESILFIHAPTAIVQSEQIAAALAPVIRDSPHNVLSCWLGQGGVARARQLFSVDSKIVPILSWQIRIRQLLANHRSPKPRPWSRPSHRCLAPSECTAPESYPLGF